MDIRLSRAESRVKEAEEFARRSLNERLHSARMRTQEIDRRLGEVKRAREEDFAQIRKDHEAREWAVRRKCEERIVLERQEMQVRLAEMRKQSEEARESLQKDYNELLKELKMAVQHSLDLSRQIGGPDNARERREYRRKICNYGLEMTPSPDIDEDREPELNCAM